MKQQIKITLGIKHYVTEIHKEINGLALCKTLIDGRWHCIHMKTLKPIAPRLNTVDCGKKRKDMLAFVEYLAPLFPWNEWNDADEIPTWGKAAYKKITDFKTLVEMGAL